MLSLGLAASDAGSKVCAMYAVCFSACDGANDSYRLGGSC